LLFLKYFLAEQTMVTTLFPSNKALNSGPNQEPDFGKLPPALEARLVHLIRSEELSGWLLTASPLLSGDAPQAVILSEDWRRFEQLLDRLEFD
jgi:hypothetical protein